jgi:hypothetical protein
MAYGILWYIDELNKTRIGTFTRNIELGAAHVFGALFLLLAGLLDAFLEESDKYRCARIYRANCIGLELIMIIPKKGKK